MLYYSWFLKVMIADDDNPSIWKDYCTPDYNLVIIC